MNLNEWVIFGVLILGILGGGLLVSYIVERTLKRLGLQVHVFPDPNPQPEPDSASEQPEQPQPQPAADPNAMRGNGAIISGRCRGCDLLHVGLIPAFIELTGPQEFNIPGGIPAVCPRCWVKMNPGMATNTTPLPPQADNQQNTPHPSHRSSGYPVPEAPKPHLSDDQIREAMEPRKDYEQPAGPDREHLPGGIEREGVPAVVQDFKVTDEKLDRLTRPEPKSESVPQCSRCNRVTGEFKPDKNGKLWCQACIDALGGPKPKPNRRKGK